MNSNGDIFWHNLQALSLFPKTLTPPQDANLPVLNLPFHLQSRFPLQDPNLSVHRPPSSKSPPHDIAPLGLQVAPLHALHQPRHLQLVNLFVLHGPSNREYPHRVANIRNCTFFWLKGDLDGQSTIHEVKRINDICDFWKFLPAQEGKSLQPRAPIMCYLLLPKHIAARPTNRSRLFH